MKTASTGTIHRKLVALLLTLVMIIGMLPFTALAAESNLPEWRFLVAIFTDLDVTISENDVDRHIRNTLSAEDVETLRKHVAQFEEFWEESGAIKPQVDIIQIDTPVTALMTISSGFLFSYNEALPMLENAGVQLDQYDHVTALVRMDNIQTLVGATAAPFSNGTGYSVIDAGYCLKVADTWDPPGGMVHEFLHFMEGLCARWGWDFDIHGIRLNHYYPDTDYGKKCYTDIVWNRAIGESGTGVPLAAWSYTPRSQRSSSVLVSPEGAVSIGKRFPQYCTDNVTRVIVRTGVTGISDYAFLGCKNLERVDIHHGISTIGEWAFANCTNLKRADIPVTVTSIGKSAFSNSGLLEIHYGGSEVQWAAIEKTATSVPNRAKISYDESLLFFDAILSRADPTIVTLTNYGDLFDSNTGFIAAKYKDNKMVDIAVNIGSLQPNGAVQFSKPLGSTWKLFFLSDDYKPLCETVELQ